MKCNTILERIEELELTKREYALAGAVLFLLGVVIGMLCSPRKNKMFGCNNGNHNGSRNNDCHFLPKAEAKVKR